jgi:precorrin-3B synthase
MEAADGLLVRLRLPGGSIASAGLRTVAEVAERFGNGVVELTSRANVQIRGLHPGTLDEVARLLAAGGPAGADTAREQRRDVVVSPLTGHDPHQWIDLTSTALAAAHLLTTTPDLDGLPPKFGVVFDDGGTTPVREVPGDLCFGAVPSAPSEPSMQLELGRALNDADPTVACIPATDALRVVIAGARLCSSHRARLSELVERQGRPQVVAAVTDGVSVRWEHGPSPSATVHPVGVLAHPTVDRVNLGAAPLLGRVSPTMLRAVADLVDASSSHLRLTPWRGIVLLGVATSDADLVLDGLGGAGFSADPSDPAHLVSACAGSPGCQASRVDTMGAAVDLLDGPTPPTRRVHLSGCEKRCGANADRVLVADERGSFDLDSLDPERS